MNNKNDRYKWYVLAILTVVYMFNFIDRHALVILQEDIKQDLALSDTQLGFLTGLAFAILYVGLGIPLAKLADSYNRKNLLTFCLFIWSLMTYFSGRAQNFVQMSLTRLGVSAGEAGCAPTSHSIISDYFPAEQRATAIAIFTSGIFFGVLFGFVVAGWMASSYGWRVAFYILGISGMVLAILLSLFLKEPIRGQFDKIKNEGKDPSFKEVLSYMLGQKTFLYMCIADGFSAFAINSSGNFLPSFLMRVHNLDLMTVSIAIGLSAGVGGVLGTIMGGRIADKKGITNKRWYLFVPVIGCLLSLFPAAIMYFSDNTNLVLSTILPTT